MMRLKSCFPLGRKSNRFYALIVAILLTFSGLNSMQAAGSDGLEESTSQEQQDATITVTGTVTDQNGESVPGVNVVVAGTSTGTVTDMEGRYTIDAPEDATLEFSFIGFDDKEVQVEGRSSIDVTLQEQEQELDEVVVTALGIERDKKQLGYAMQEVDGESLLDSRDANVANSLSGKISGLDVIKSSAGPAASSKIVLRGNSSLTGDNQPLIVVDGVPVDNFTGAENNDYWNPSLDMGSGLGDISPENIESMSVLKGASAAALYGSRAADGVILITTKSGKKQEGVGITVTSSLGVETIFTNPEMQKSFGQGTEKSFDNRSSSSWGPEIKGQELEMWDGETRPLRAYDNVENYFDTGVVQDHSVSFQQKYDKTSVYTSFNHKDDQSKIPGSDLERTNLTTRVSNVFGPQDRWSMDTKVQYINSNAHNRPLLGANPSNPYYTMYLLPVSLDIRDFDPAVDESGEMIWYGGGQQVNPYWSSRYNLNEDTRDRFILHSSITYEFTDWLNAEIRGGSDRYTTNTESKVYGGSPLTPTGRYSEGKETFYENNYSARINASQDNLFGKIGGSAMLGGNLMAQRFSSIDGSSGDLEVPDLFTLNNGQDEPDVDEGFREKKINSVYGNMSVNYDGYAFLEGTFRNDWSSTLSEENRSFFYPSVTASYIPTDMFDKMGISLPSWLTYTKVRASYAEVGNDMGAYQLYNTYEIGKGPLGNTTAGTGDVLYNPDVKNELKTSWEVGADVRLFNNRLAFDFSWYKENATNQLLNIPMDPLSGYENKKINAGDIQNKGIELMANARILKQSNGLNWDLQVNFSKNENTIEKLADDVDKYKLGGFDAVEILAEAGGKYGEIYGTTFMRVEDEDSEHYGELLLDGNGLPQEDPESEKLGNQQPDAKLGVINSLSYKGLRLSFQVDGRLGGEIFSGTNQGMQAAGTAEATAPDGKREEMVVDGVYESDGSYVQNDNSITTQQYWDAVAGVGNVGIVEANVYDATNIRLRNVNLSYNLPEQWIGSSPLQRANVGVSVNNVWLIHSNLNGVDPESVFATGTNATGFENAAPPTSRTFKFNLTLGF